MQKTLVSHHQLNSPPHLPTKLLLQQFFCGPVRQTFNKRQACPPNLQQKAGLSAEASTKGGSPSTQHPLFFFD
jgi:hypothetical protein